MIGNLPALHSNLSPKLTRLTSYHEAKPLKLLKLYLENMSYKIFHFSIKITPLDFSKIRQHNDYTVVKPKIQKSRIKKIHSQYFPKSNYNHKDLWSSSKYKIKKSIQHNFIATCFSQNHACIFYKRYLHIQNVTF